MIEQIRFFFREIRELATTPVFIFLTLIGNGFILTCGYAFYLVEKDHNPAVNRFIDAVWWSFTTATTTGYGNITPVTDFGKILSIILMITGLTLFAMFTALFADMMLLARNRNKLR